jgi:putative endonuclease
MPYYVYMLLCRDGSYYTGYTNNITARFKRHKHGTGARYTRSHAPKKVAHIEVFSTRRAAMRRERYLKTLTHREKSRLAAKTRRGSTIHL